MGRELQVALLVAGAAWIACALIPASVRIALRNGLRCMGRYPDLWRIPLAFGLCHGLFLLGAEIAFIARTGDVWEWLTSFTFQEPPNALPASPDTFLQAAEFTASIFALFTGTFPLSALCALAFLANYNGLFIEISRAILRRFPRFGWLLVVLLAISALATIVRPIAYVLMPELSGWIGFYGIAALVMPALIFELLLGLFFLTYLMLMAYAWMRGLHFHRYKLFLVAARRTGFVLKWSLPLATLSFALVFVPQLLALLVDDAAPGVAGSLRAASDPWGRLLVTLLVLFFCATQATLVFHNESLHDALRDSVRFSIANIASILPFIAAVFLPFLVLEGASTYLAFSLGGTDTVGFGIARLGIVVAGSLLGGWFIAAWVCLYKSRFSSRKEIPF